jgi:hypothetical protein
MGLATPTRCTKKRWYMVSSDDADALTCEDLQIHGSQKNFLSAYSHDVLFGVE